MAHLDDMFGQFAEAFLGNMVGEGDIPLRGNLDTSKLNYSASSLNIVDDYLNVLYNNGSELSDLEYQNVIVWCGAYVGEVIRKNAIMEYHWIGYEEYMEDKSPALKNMIPLGLTTHAILASSKNMTMPMNKIARWLDEGDSNNVHFYAMPEIKKAY